MSYKYYYRSCVSLLLYNSAQ